MADSIIQNIEPDVDIINITTEFTTIEVTTLGTQGMVGAKGEKGDKGDIGNPLEFDLLTEQQKIELRGDVGDTSVNYTNLFLNSLLN